MALLTTSTIPENLRPGIRAWFGAYMNTYETIYDKIFDVKVPDARAYEEDVTLSALGLPKVKTQGADVSYDAGQQLYVTRYEHVQYGLGFVITEEAIEDGVALKLAQTFAENLKLNMLRGREIFTEAVLDNAFASVYMQGGDGVCLGSSAHPTAAANFSNVPTSPATLSEASLEQAVIDISLFTDNRGLLLHCRPEKIQIHPNNMFTAQRILASTLRSNTTANDVNAIKDMGILSADKVVVQPYQTSTTNWFVRTDQPGLIMFNRKDITLSEDNAFDSNNLKTKGLMRMSAGWSDPRAIYCVNS